MPLPERHQPDDQTEAYAFLDTLVRAEPGSRRIDTHANTVFLIGGDAYKMKRAVRFPFLDYSALPLRRRAVTAELTRNRLFAPELYPGETAVIRRTDGTLALGGEGSLWSRWYTCAALMKVPRWTMWRPEDRCRNASPRRWREPCRCPCAGASAGCGGVVCRALQLRRAE
ncbi:hypothetical protein V6L77_15790 [Pannonibacter sp. Pt2-lr]